MWLESKAYQRGRRLWVNLTYRVEKGALPLNSSSVGIDMGVADRLSLSTARSSACRVVARAVVVGGSAELFWRTYKTESASAIATNAIA